MVKYLRFYYESLSRNRFEIVTDSLIDSGDPEVWYALCLFYSEQRNPARVEAVERHFVIQKQKIDADNGGEYFESKDKTYSRESFMAYYGMCRNLLHYED